MLSIRSFVAYDYGVNIALHAFRYFKPRARMSWAQLLKRVFAIDLTTCPQCGGALTLMAAIEDPAVIVKILAHLGLPTRAPPRAPARIDEFFQTA
jgi:hypothetical protein